MDIFFVWLRFLAAGSIEKTNGRENWAKKNSTAVEFFQNSAFD